MSVKRDDIAFSRSGTVLTVELLNFEEGDTWNIYLADSHIGAPSKVASDIDTASYDITDTDPESNYYIRVSLNNAPLDASVGVVEDLSWTESYIVVEAKGSAEIVDGTATFETPWLESDLTDMAVAELSNPIIEWEPGGPRTSIAKNRTL